MRRRNIGYFYYEFAHEIHSKINTIWEQQKFIMSCHIVPSQEQIKNSKSTWKCKALRSFKAANWKALPSFSLELKITDLAFINSLRIFRHKNCSTWQQTAEKSELCGKFSSAKMKYATVRLSLDHHRSSFTDVLSRLEIFCATRSSSSTNLIISFLFRSFVSFCFSFVDLFFFFVRAFGDSVLFEQHEKKVVWKIEINDLIDVSTHLFKSSENDLI